MFFHFIGAEKLLNST